MSENDFERALSESFNNAYNNNVPISTSEANNVNDIFVGNEVKTECIICYEDDRPCIKCFQCTAVYCKTCLTKIASESNKCICSIDIKNNYCNLKTYNQNLIKKAREEKEIKDKKEKQQRDKKNKNTHSQNSNYNKNNNNKNSYTQNSNNTNTILNNNFNADLINNYLINETNSNSTDFNLNLKLNFLEDLKNNKIYNIDFKSFCNKIDSSTPNFDYYWDYTDKTLTFYHIPNTNNDIKNIVFDYTILDAENQAELYIWILQLLKLPLSKYKQKWNTISNIMPKITTNNKINMIHKIITICNSH